MNILYIHTGHVFTWRNWRCYGHAYIYLGHDLIFTWRSRLCYGPAYFHPGLVLNLRVRWYDFAYIFIQFIKLSLPDVICIWCYGLAYVNPGHDFVFTDVLDDMIRHIFIKVIKLSLPDVIYDAMTLHMIIQVMPLSLTDVIDAMILHNSYRSSNCLYLT